MIPWDSIFRWVQVDVGSLAGSLHLKLEPSLVLICLAGFCLGLLWNVLHNKAVSHCDLWHGLWVLLGDTPCRCRRCRVRYQLWQFLPWTVGAASSHSIARIPQEEASGKSCLQKIGVGWTVDQSSAQFGHL